MRPIALIAFLASLAPATTHAANLEWVIISDGVLEQLEKQNQKPAWPGKTAGVAVDVSTGNVYMLVSGRG
ncbi:hypothetical protein HQ560_10840, partial [bacterium]|nr:hypothetical protein [bacterium]